MSNRDWQNWYDNLPRRLQLHYHYNRRLFFDDGYFERADRVLGYPEWTEPVIQVIRKLGCLLFTHDFSDGWYSGPASCAYCGKVKNETLQSDTHW